MPVADDLHKAIEAHRQGKPELAEPIYESILSRDPNHAEARHMMGILALQRGNLILAEKEIRHAIRSNDKEPKYFNNLANVCHAQGQLEAASEALHLALALDPSFTEARFNLANILREQGQTEQSIIEFEATLTLDPTHGGAHNNLGQVLHDVGREKEGFEHYKTAHELAPQMYEALQNVAVALKQQGRDQEAREKFQLLLDMKPTDGGRLNLVLTLPALVDSREEIEQVRSRFADGLNSLGGQALNFPDPLSELGGLSHFYLAYHGKDDRPFNQALGDIFRRGAPSLSYVAPHCADKAKWRPGKKLRLGIVSKYLRDHTIGFLMRDLIRMLPRDSLEVIVIGQPYENALAKEIRKSADQFVPLGTDLTTARQTIAGLKLDALFFTDIGMDPFTYFLAFSRLAPVQATTWGHPVTSGIDTVDYFISSKHLEIPEADAHYTEALVRLASPPTCLVRPDPPGPLDRAHFGFDQTAHLYVCPQTMFKLHPDIDQVFAEILRGDPKGEVVLIDAQDFWTAKVKARFARTIPDVADRIRFIERMSLPAFLNLLQLADVMLDTLHFSGGLTSLQAFSFGTPIVTLPSDFMRGRVTAAYYRQMGIEAGIATSPEDYVQRALALGTDRAARTDLSKTILEAGRDLYGNVSVARDMANFFIEAVEQARRD